MNNTVAIVQPYEHMSIAEQKYVLDEYARDSGAAIDYFIGDDDVLRSDSPVFDALLDSMKQGIVKRILLLHGIAGNLPKGFCDACSSLGGEVCSVDHRRAVLLTG
jgi:hypothetical protein